MLPPPYTAIVSRACKAMERSRYFRTPRGTRRRVPLPAPVTPVWAVGSFPGRQHSDAACQHSCT